MCGHWVPGAREPVRNDHGHGPDGELNGLLRRADTARADIRMVRADAIDAAQFVLRRLLVGQFPGIHTRLPVRPEATADHQHVHVVRAGRGQPVGRRDVRRPGLGGRQIRTGPVLRVHVPNDPRHNGQVGAAARAQPARRVRGQWHTNGHHDHAGHVRVYVQQKHAGLADRLLPERRRRVGLDDHMDAAGRLVAVLASVRQPRRTGLHPSVVGQHCRTRRQGNTSTTSLASVRDIIV